MKKYFAYAMTLLAACFVSACSDDEEPAGYTGKNGVTLTVQSGNTTLIEDEDAAVTVSVALDRAYDTDIKLTVDVQGKESERLLINPQPVTITAGNTSATFQVTSAKLGNLNEQLQYTLSVTNLQSDMELVNTVNINLRARTSADDLTEAQKALVESWKANYGIDVTKWIGQIPVAGDVTEPGDGLASFSKPKNTTITGASVITLGEGCTEDKIVLKMVDNPMGLTAFLYDWFRRNTVEDSENFANEDGWSIGLMNKINWNKDTQETFNVSLDGIEIDLTQTNEDGSFNITYVKEGTAYILGLDGTPLMYTYDEEVGPEAMTYSKESWIPFKYEFTAWTRLQQLVAEGDEEALEYAVSSATSDPEYFLLNSSVNEDGFDSEENNYYVKPSGSIDFATGKMTFTFPADHQYAGGYSRVNVTYTAN